MHVLTGLKINLKIISLDHKFSENTHEVCISAQKYKAIIDTNDIDFGDNSTKKSKRSGATRPLSLSQRKIDYIQECATTGSCYNRVEIL